MTRNFFVARYTGGECAECGLYFEEGEQACYQDGEPMHLDCAEEVSPLETKPGKLRTWSEVRKSRGKSG